MITVNIKEGYKPTKEIKISQIPRGQAFWGSGLISGDSAEMGLFLKTYVNRDCVFRLDDASIFPAFEDWWHDYNPDKLVYNYQPVDLEIIVK